MKPSEFRNMTLDELKRTIASLRDEYFKLRIRRGSEALPNPLRLRVIRRDIAKALTILKELDKKETVEKGENAKS
ncbi:MAG: 50S ribosomal protein L29 [bacterium]|nr:50S ribosomal protein L29 [candidate division WOR-3 bacterium]MDH5683524.1 50S ribosomal protein L29 [candidate division WOR-3 bacterium]